MSGLRIIVADCFPQINPELWGQTQRVIKNTIESIEISSLLGLQSPIGKVGKSRKKFHILIAFKFFID